MVYHFIQLILIIVFKLFNLIYYFFNFKKRNVFSGDNLYTGLSVAKECSMIPPNVNLAVITATPSTELDKAAIKIEPALGYTTNVSLYCNFFFQL